MAQPTELIAIGEETGIILSEDALARLGAKSGDTLYLSEASDGSFALTISDPTLTEQIGIGETIIREDRDIPGRLAK